MANDGQVTPAANVAMLVTGVVGAVLVVGWCLVTGASFWAWLVWAWLPWTVAVFTAGFVVQMLTARE